jgi:hypothetical protein
MSLGFFIVGGVIFAVYMYLTIWNIFYSSKKQREENYPNISNVDDIMDYDGMGNYGRFPKELQPRTRVSKKISKSKMKEKV